jgi:hypothetical protein
LDIARWKSLLQNLKSKKNKKLKRKFGNELVDLYLFANYWDIFIKELISFFGAGCFKSANDGGSSASVGVSEAIRFMDIEKPIAVGRKNSMRAHDGAFYLANFGSNRSVP